MIARFLRRACLLWLLVLGAQNTFADNIFGEFQRVPDDIERGFTVSGDFGLLVITNQETTSATNPGFQLALALGYDFSRYLSIEGISTVGINEASPFDPVLTGGVNTFLFNLAVKGQWPIYRFYPFLEVGPGFHYSRPEFTSGKDYHLNILFGGGVEYFTYLRHYSLYAKANYFYIDLPIDAMSFSVGIKYTF